MSIYEVVYHELEKHEKERNLETLEDFTGIIREIHNIVEVAVEDFITDYKREDLEEEYLPMF